MGGEIEGGGGNVKAEPLAAEFVPKLRGGGAKLG